MRRIVRTARRYHWLLPAACLATLITQIGCPPMMPIYEVQKVIRLDQPACVQPDYVLTEVVQRRDDNVSPPLYYAFRLDDNRELQICPGEYPFAVIVDGRTGKADQAGREIEPPSELWPRFWPSFACYGWPTRLDFPDRNWTLVFDRSGKPIAVIASFAGHAQRFDPADGWSEPVPETQLNTLLREDEKVAPWG